jgi:tetratricopeptide (TPR) repeat protein
LAETAQVVSVQSPAAPELEAARLDARFPGDRGAVLQRFALARQLGDSRALEWVLTEEMGAILPEEVRDQALLVLGRAALSRGENERAWFTLEQVRSQDLDAYGEAQELLGELALAAGELKVAKQAFREAARAGNHEALMGLASVYAEVGRYDLSDDYLALVPPDAGVWGEAQTLRAEMGLSGSQMPGATLGFLMAAQMQGDYHALAGPLVEVVAWRRLCWHDHADELESRARAEAEQQLAWLESLSGPRWPTFRTGPLPASWFEQLARSPEMAPLLERLQRLSSAPPTPALAERHRHTLEQLETTLASAYDRARDELRRGLALQMPVEGPVVSYRAERVRGRVWPYRGELWADETGIVVSVPSRCR